MTGDSAPVDVNARPCPGVTLQSQLRTQRARPFAHDAQAKVARGCAGLVEATSIVGDPQVDARIASAKTNLSMGGLGMFVDVVQRLLRDAIQTDLEVGWQRALALRVHLDLHAAA